nr:MAG: hypothetical protein [Bacteriophage sp.]
MRIKLFINKNNTHRKGEKSMKAFKGFNKDLTCRGYQYEEGKEFHTERAECCDTGFHACEYPLDCFGYYDPAHSVYHEVELSGEMDKSGDNTKVCATDIKIGARLSIAGLVKMAIDFTMSKVNKEAGSDERHGFASATGNYGASSATGDCGASSATGYKGASSVSDPTGVAVAWGHEARAKGCKGAHLILSDWKYVGARYSDGDYMDPYDKESWKLTGAKMVVVDGEKIKEDTYYRCIEGEIVEVTEDGESVEE